MNQSHLEDWTIRFNDPSQKLAFALRVSTYTSHNGFKSVSDAHFFTWQIQDSKPAEIKAFREIHDKNALQISEGSSANSPPVLRLSDIKIDENRTVGTIQSNKRTVSWDLKLHYRSTHKIERKLPNGGIERHETGLRSDGKLQIGDQTYKIQDAYVCRSWSQARQLPYKRIWASASNFLDHASKPIDFQFEATTLLPTKKTFFKSSITQDYFFFYDNQVYRAQGKLASWRNHSDWNFNSWEFRAECGDLSFRGRLQAENRELSGLQWTDTDEKNVFKNQSGLADLTIHIYRSDKLETSVHCKQSAFFETIADEKNPYAPYLY